MIARIWTARATSANAPRYAQHLRDSVLPLVQQSPGYQGATLLQHSDGAGVEIIVMTWWRTMEDIRSFAGPESSRAVVAEEARALLTQFDWEVRHFEVTLEDRPSE